MTYRHFNNESTRSSVIRAVADTENAAAWNRLFDLYAGFVYSIARRKGLNDADADDILVLEIVLSEDLIEILQALAQHPHRFAAGGKLLLRHHFHLVAVGPTEADRALGSADINADIIHKPHPFLIIIVVIPQAILL